MESNLNDYKKIRAELLVIKNGITFEQAGKELKETYERYAKEDSKTYYEIWLEDYKMCYDSDKQELEELKALKISETKQEAFKDHYKHKIPVDLIKACEADFDSGVVQSISKENHLLIKGASDIGKSHLAVAIMKVLIENGMNKCEMFFEDEFDRLNYEDSIKEVDRLSKLDVLAIDDLGAIGLNQFKKNLIKGLIYSRFRDGKKTIICTNISIEDYYDVRTASKIIGACTIIEKQDTGTRKENKKIIKI